MLLFASSAAENASMAEWTAAHIAHVSSFAPPYQCAAVLDGGQQTVAGIVFHDWQAEAHAMQLSMAATSPRWAHPDTLAALFRYAFINNGAHKLWTATPSTGKRAIRFNIGIGMKREASLRDQFGPGVDAEICSMLAPEWRASRWWSDNQRKAA